LDQETVDKKSLDTVSKELVSYLVLNNSDKGVRLFASCCLADILRLYAPEPPYNDKILKVYDAFSSPSSFFSAYASYVPVLMLAILALMLLVLNSFHFSRKFLSSSSNNSTASEIRQVLISQGIITCLKAWQQLKAASCSLN